VIPNYGVRQMSPEIADKLRNSIKKHEGFRQYLYTDSTGNASIGYGRNLHAVGISITEADILLGDDITNATMELYRFLPLAQDLDDVRKAVLIEFTFNIGIEKVLQFRAMIKALEEKDYKAAAAAMLDSEWAKQVHSRANDMSYSMETGIL